MSAHALPCPFCGVDAEGPYFVTGTKFHWVVSCPGCGATIQRYLHDITLRSAGRDEVLNLWNARVEGGDDAGIA